MVQKSAPRPRGRPRAYEPEAALAQATLAFWRGGYSATSLDTLSAATGMNRPSLYGAFGDKRALYLAALQRYTDAALQGMAQALDSRRPLRVGLQRVYELALKLYYPPSETARGCLLVGTAATEAVADDQIRALLGRALRAFDAAFETRLRLAVETGELPAAADPVLLSRVASAFLHTLALRSRAGDKRSELAATAAAGVDLVCGTLRP